MKRKTRTILIATLVVPLAPTELRDIYRPERAVWLSLQLAERLHQHLLAHTFAPVQFPGKAERSAIQFMSGETDDGI